MRLIDVAERAGVSIVTASRVLNGDPKVRTCSRERVLGAARELNYTPNLLARGLVKGRSGFAALYISHLENPFFGSLCESLLVRLKEAGYDTLICRDTNGHGDICGSFLASGTIMVSNCDEGSIREVLGLGRPVMGINSYAPADESFPNILFDFAPSYRRISELLIGAGRRKIAFLSHVPLDFQHRKFSAARQVLDCNGIEPVAPAGGESFASLQEIKGFLEINRQKNAVDAVFCENDMLASELCCIVSRLGLKVPEDISIVGCDGTLELDGVWTVKIDIDSLVERAVRIFACMIEGTEIDPALLSQETIAIVR